MVLVSFTDTLASDTKYRYRYRWFLIIDTIIGIGIADAQAPILVSVSLKTYGIAHLWNPPPSVFLIIIEPPLTV